MYVLRVLQFLLPLLVAIKSEENIQVQGTYNPEYPQRSSSTGFLLDYLRSRIGQDSPSRYDAPPKFPNGYDTGPHFQSGYETEPHFQSGYETEPHFQSGYETEPHFQSGYKTEPHFQSGYKTEPHFKSGYETEPHFQSGYETGPHFKGGHDTGLQSKNKDVTKLCDTVTCSNGTCSVIIKDEYSYPVTICAAKFGDAMVPRDVNAACRKKGFTTAVLTGDPNAFRPLRPFSCLGCEDCPYGTTCVNNACCFGNANCNETLNMLFEKSFEFDGNTYTLSRFLVQNDMHASAICVAQGGYLVEIETREENNAIKNFLRDCMVLEDVLIAGTDADEEGNFIYQYSGATVGFFDWDIDNGQPDGMDAENCIVLDSDSDFLWYDEACDLGDFRFLCEFPEAPEPDRKKKYGYH